MTKIKNQPLQLFSSFLPSLSSILELIISPDSCPFKDWSNPDSLAQQGGFIMYFKMISQGNQLPVAGLYPLSLCGTAHLNTGGGGGYLSTNRKLSWHASF